ncbi:MAG: hypothetical protein JJ863_28195 [Deltaproteobacteria bacterium]|nr:hypothetical protein [Deltaproteobacteria bacterium]
MRGWVWGMVLMGGCGLTLDLEPPDQRPDAAAREDGGRVEVDSGTRDAGETDALVTRDAARPRDGFVPPDDAEVCVALAESCNALDDDCDGAADEDYDFDTDIRHCGACDQVCEGRGGIPRCEAGACRIQCDPGRADCDDSLDNGCEADLTSATSCGACGSVCAASAPRCVRNGAGAFSCVSMCDADLATCDGACVDTETNASHCGGCGNACFLDPHGMLACRAGVCEVEDCGDWHDDCNDDPSDGCEASLQTNTNCGSCGATCGSGQMCLGGLCVAMMAD